MFNVDKYIDRCLKSILNQNSDQSFFEIILINDGATDGSLFLSKKYYIRFKYLKTYSANNNGLSAARNLGIKLAYGKYLFIIYSDDFIIKNSLKLLIEKAFEFDLDILGFKASRVKETSSYKKMNKILNSLKKKQLFPLTLAKLTKRNYIFSLQL